MSRRNPIAGVILAGGLSRRMGSGDKALLSLAGRPMIAHVIDRLAPQVAFLAINANGDPARFQRFGLPVVADPVADFPGPLAGILGGLRWASGLSGITHIATAAADTPFLPRAFVATFSSAGSPEAIVVARRGSAVHQVCALWPLEIAPVLSSWLRDGGSRKVMDFITAQPHAFADFPAMEAPQGAADPFFNVNTPVDLVRAEEFAAGLAQ